MSLERLEQMAEDALIYRFDTPQLDGPTQSRHTPLELSERLALIPPRAFTATLSRGAGLNSHHRMTAFGRGFGPLNLARWPD